MAGKTVPSTGIICRPAPSLLRRASLLATSSAERLSVGNEHEAAIATASQKGAGIVIRGGAAKGAPIEGKQARLHWERWRRAHLDDLLDGMTPMEFILRFTFTNPDLDTTIVGTINPAHLQTNLDILQQGPLPPDVYEEAKLRLAAAGSAPQAGGA
jgi:aryl-alcohol dehydrogenase-like predicted oxidoreductase